MQTSLLLFLPSVTRYSILDLYQAVIVTLSSFVQHPVAFHRLSVGDTDTSATMPSHLWSSLSRLRRDLSMPSPITPPIEARPGRRHIILCRQSTTIHPSHSSCRCIRMGISTAASRATLGKDHDKKEREKGWRESDCVAHVPSRLWPQQ